MEAGFSRSRRRRVVDLSRQAPFCPVNFRIDSSSRTAAQLRRASTSCHRAPSDDLADPSPEGEFSLYIHLPFCERKCPYCHFYVSTRIELRDTLVEAIVSEWRGKRSWTKGRALRSVYFGGGTPSLFRAEHFERLIGAFEIDGAQEITVEVNPEHARLDYFRQLRDCGVNRISLGAQSLNSRSLRTLGRRHTPEMICRAVKAASSAGLEDLSLDLMFDLPDQTLSEWQSTLRQVRDLPISHLSIYNLTIEPGTPFHRRRSHLLARAPSDSVSAEMYQSANAILSSGDWRQYEISAYCRRVNYSVHNTGYWRGRAFLGLGPSAWSFWRFQRWQNPPNLHLYLQNAENRAISHRKEELCAPARRRELFIIHLRLNCGVDLSAFATRWGAVPFSADQLAGWIAAGHLAKAGSRVTMTDRGRLFYDALAADLI